VTNRLEEKIQDLEPDVASDVARLVKGALSNNTAERRALKNMPVLTVAEGRHLVRQREEEAGKKADAALQRWFLAAAKEGRKWRLSASQGLWKYINRARMCGC
jgi:hypothetical protein